MGEALIPGLGEQLGQAAERLHRRRRRRMRAATAGVVATLALAVVTVAATLDAPPAAAGVDVEERDGRLFVRLTDLESRAGVVEDALRAAGIEADVTSVAVGPSNLGRFVSLNGTGEAEDLELLDYDGSTYGSFAVSTSYAGELGISIGRLASEGQRYARGSNALAPGEPLACLDIVGRPARDLAAVAAEHPDVDITAEAYTVGEPVVGGLAAADLPGGTYADWRVVEATAEASDRVKVVLTSDGQTPFARPALPPPPGCD